MHYQTFLLMKHLYVIRLPEVWNVVFNFKYSLDDEIYSICSKRLYNNTVKKVRLWIYNLKCTILQIHFGP